MKYFFDSYAIIEIVKGNPLYAKYAYEVVILTQFNLAEIYWSFLKDFPEEKAKELYWSFRECVVPVEDIVLQNAMKFRKEHKKRRLSYADCIGYCYALHHNLFFLTGDKEFEKLPHVEFQRKD